MSHNEVKHIALLNNIVEESNKLENAGYLKGIINFLDSILYIKQKYKPIVGSYQKVKINKYRMWSPEADLKIEYLAKEIPLDIKFSMVTKIMLLSNDKYLKEDIAATQINRSEIVREKVPREIVNGFFRAYQHLRVLNATIQNPGWIMEESAYSNYEDPRGHIQKLFPKYGII